ncbi:hypothetical protein DPEC_G00005520 [Dallia pectoralis]|uniref:Uncharacterized protein n=1 Tax=Dallia pectoralis TaxID=75939 RepID=A0ACC2HK41_DALPE|nr:hypothetical protein DPEC_G00005520 [Dallia pectoralis]
MDSVWAGASAGAGRSEGLKASPFLPFPCLPAFTTFGALRLPWLEAPAEVVKEERGVEEVDFGEVGEAEEADIEERFLLPGTAFGAEPPLGSFALAELEAALGSWDVAELAGVEVAAE